MIEKNPAPPLYQRDGRVAAAILIVAVMGASLIECKVVLAIQSRIHPHYASHDTRTVPLGHSDLGNAFDFHAALNGTEITDQQDSQLIMGITNTLADRRYVASLPWSRLTLRVTDPAGVESTWPVLGGTVSPPPTAAAPLPEMIDALDVSALHAGTKTIQYPHWEGIFAIYLLKNPPSWTTFREQSGTYHVLAREGRYRLQIIYTPPEGPRVLADYADLWVK